MSDIYEIISLGSDSWRIEEGGVRAFLFTGTDRALLVDSGFGKGNIKEVVEKITKLPVMLVNTHVDGDHTGCNSLFEAAYMHPSEQAYYYNKEHNNAPANAEVRPLWEGDVIDLGTRRFEVILIPGHSPGSIALFDRVNRLLISGDSVSDSAIFMFGSHRNLRAYISSLNKLKKHGGFDTIYPSHGSIPLKPDIIDKLLNGANLLLEGRLEGRQPPFDIPAKLYTSDGAMFLYK
jgi:glyoxylase-like metal-dependent hydrolase (beta-lactamase superfamily II)